jgi:bacillithiol biosynthesis cysteine-adding enzyme BshC
MIFQQIDLKNTRKFSQFFLDYLAGKDQLKKFGGLPPEISSFKKQIDGKQYPVQSREILVNTLKAQYEKLSDVPAAVLENIASLQNSNTFTITTGHQLNLCTGPMYVIYKLVTIIRACEELNKAYPEYNFVPLYWMASEDHDFEEIDHFNFNGNTYRWNSSQKGAVGRFELNDIRPLLHELSAIPAFFHKAYGAKWNLADAVRCYMNDLFGEYGLVVLDPDNHDQKSLFKSAMKADIIDNSQAPEVLRTSEELQALGYKTQINPREINFFYVEEQLRSRIEKAGDSYQVVDTDISFNLDEMRGLIDEKPECLSPNVVLRPLYQETILPNLAYVGGPSELIYWLQLKGVFDKMGISFPILMPRNFGLVVPAHVERKRARTEIPIESFFEGADNLVETVVKEESENVLSLDTYQDQLEALFSEIKEKAGAIDQTLVAHVDAQRQRGNNALSNIEKKFLRAEKRNHDTLTNQIESVYYELFPGGGLQERHDNFLNFYQSDPSFINRLMEYFDPFDYRFNILTYGD